MSNQHSTSPEGEFTERSPLLGDATDSASLKDRFVAGEIPVAVYGLGKMGLPLASVYADVTGNVTGVDIDPDVVAAINDGRCHVKREPGLPDLVSELVNDGGLVATDDPSIAAADASVHVVIVPTPITDEKEPDLSILDAVVEDIATGLSPGDLVIVECTVPPKTTAERVLPALEAQSGLARREFGVAFCPERTSSGRALEDIRSAYPKVVGGVDERSTKAAAAIYDGITSNDVLPASDATTAEAVKVFEGLYRDVNIALANELATLTDELGIDVREAIDIANTQPFCDIHDPGPGVGGHCIPFYPYFIIDPFETETTLLETARDVNDRMPAFVVRKILEEFEAEGQNLETASVLLLGLTYRADVEELRASPALDICSRLATLGVTVSGVDPMIDQERAPGVDLLDLSDLYSTELDAIVLATNHCEFEAIDWGSIDRDGGQLIVLDTKDALDLSETNHRLYTLGTGSV